MNFRFSSKMSQSQQKLAKRITLFTIQFWSKSITHFSNLNSLDIENKMLPQHNQKPFWLYVCIFLYISVRKCLFQKRSKISSGGVWVGGRLKNFLLRPLAVWVLSNVLQFFILTEIFGNSAIFQHFHTSIFSIQTLKFSRQFEFQG